MIEVYDSQGNKLLEGKTNKEGQFNFKIPKKDDLKIVIIASMGHKNSYTILKDELPDVIIEDKEIGKEETFQKEVAQVDLDQIKKVIEASLDRRLKPIIKQLAKAEQKKVSFAEVVGGIGYIFGIFGVILYFISKRKRD